MKEIKIDIVSGFLGAGKTTFIKKYIQALEDEKVVLIENEFGEVGIDGSFLKDSGIEIREMNSGCICCSLVGDFATSLKEMIDIYKPDRVIIEPSGVGKLSDVKKSVLEVSNELGLNNTASVTVVDVKKVKMYMKNFGEFFNDQIKNASTIVLSRTDVSEISKLEEAIKLIKEVNNEASIISTPISELSNNKLKEILENKKDLLKELEEEMKNKKHHHVESCGCGGHHHEHDHHVESCGCGGHHHEHEHHGEGCGCGGHHHEHDHHVESCGCGGHHHEHDHHHEESCGCGGHHHGHEHHHASDVFTSFGMEFVPAIKKENLESILDRLANTTEFGIILRAKGMLKDVETNEWLYFDMVPEEISIRQGEAESSGKVCVIGMNLNKEKLEKEFK